MTRGVFQVLFAILAVHGAFGFECPNYLEGEYADVEDCTSYFRCTKGEAYKHQCPSNLYFNQRELSCDWPKNTDCVQQSDAPEIAANIARQKVSADIETFLNIGFCIGLLDGEYKNPQDCSSFYHCSNGLTFLKDCPANLHFSVLLGLCEWPEKANCTQEPAPTTANPPAPTTAAPTVRPTTPASEEFSCQDKECGRYEDEEDCSSYYICKENKTLVGHKQCPEGLFFNPLLLVCDLLGNFECSGGSQTTVTDRVSTTAGPGGDDTTAGSGGDDTTAGSGGDDTTAGSGGDETTAGSGGDDTTSGSGGDDTTAGSGGDDTTAGSGGDDTTAGSGGDDTTAGSGGDDTTAGSGGDDTTAGSGGDETTAGSGGDDTTAGSGGDDTTAGSGGDDTTAGSGGDDTTTAGPGDGGPTTTNEPPTCECGLFGDILDCTRYYLLSGGIRTYLRCHGELYFDTVSLECVAKESARCLGELEEIIDVNATLSTILPVIPIIPVIPVIPLH